jgi:hypothetical protein
MKIASLLITLLAMVIGPLIAEGSGLDEISVLTPATVTILNDGPERPSCDVVRARLNYRDAREKEILDMVAKIDRPHHLVSAKEIKQLALLQSRSDIDARELDQRNIALRAQWELPVETVAVVDLEADGLAKSYVSAEQSWSALNGVLPPSLQLEFEGITNVVVLKTLLSLARLCTLDQNFQLKLAGPTGATLLLSGTWGAP